MALIRHLKQTLGSEEAKYIDADWIDGADILDRPDDRVLFVNCAPGTLIRGTRAKKYYAIGDLLPDTHGLVAEIVRTGRWDRSGRHSKRYDIVVCGQSGPRFLRRALRRLREGGRLIARGRELMPLISQIFERASSRQTITGSWFSFGDGYHPILRVSRQLDALCLVWETSEPVESRANSAGAEEDSLSYSEVAWLAAHQI
jgi:hypothetical protein